MDCIIPENIIYHKKTIVNDATLSIKICPLAYSFPEHRARYKIFFTVQSKKDYGDGLVYLYEDNNELITTRFVDENITSEVILFLEDIIHNDFLVNHVQSPTYLIPDFSSDGHMK